MKRVLRQDRPQGAGRGCKADESATTAHRPQGEHPEGHKRLAAYPLRVLAPLLMVVALVAIAAAGYWLKRPAEAIAVPCPDPLAGCGFSHRGSPASVRFSAQPLPLQAFGLHVATAGAHTVSAEFHMVGMDMGFNRYDLRPAGAGGFAARITLPVCVTGRHDWMLYLEVDSQRYAIPFTTG
jgi:hypothetical protein